MADTLTLLSEAHSMYQDLGRDRVPAGSVWDLENWVPDIIGAPLRGRGSWLYQNTDSLTNDPDGMLYALYAAGPRLLVAHGSSIADIPLGTPASSAAASTGGIIAVKQNPFQHRDRVIFPSGDGVNVAKSLTWNGSAFTLASLPGTSTFGRYGTVFKDRTVLANTAANPSRVGFSKPGDPTLAWDTISTIDTSQAVTAVAAQRNQILCFHASSVERLRGSTPPDSTATDPTGDMVLDTLFDRAGCYDARSVALWNDNVIFADARGIHITDGAIVRNMAAQGGILTPWRQYFGGDTSRGAVVSLAGVVYRDLYLCCIRSASGPPITFVCDIPTRRFYRFGNIDTTSFAFSVGISEKLYATHIDAAGSHPKKATDLTRLFDPDVSVVQRDGNGFSVLPILETGFLKLSKKAGYKRVLDLFFEYTAREATNSGQDVLELYYLTTPEDTVYEKLVPGLQWAGERLRRKVGFRRRVLGVTLKVWQVLLTRDTRLYDISARMYTEEESRV